MLGSGDHLARPCQLVLELVLAAEQVGAGDPDTGELQLGGVRRPATELVELAHHLQSRRAAGHDEKGLPAVAEFLVYHGVHDVDGGDAAVADPHLVPVDDPIVTISSRRGAQIADVAAALGFGDGQRGQFEVARCAEAFWRPLQHLFGCRRLADRRQRERGHHDRQSDSGTTPEQLLHEHGQGQTRRIADQVAIEEWAVETALGGLLEHGPWELLARVVVRRDGADHLLRELVGPPGEVVLGDRRRQVEAHQRPPISVDMCSLIPTIGVQEPPSFEAGTGLA